MGLKNLPHVCQKFKKFTIFLVPCAAFPSLSVSYGSLHPAYFSYEEKYACRASVRIVFINDPRNPNFGRFVCN